MNAKDDQGKTADEDRDDIDLVIQLVEEFGVDPSITDKSYQKASEMVPEPRVEMYLQEVERSAERR